MGVHSEVEAESDMDDPVVGWLVVIRGKGQGDFGDKEISSERHVVLIYDTRQRRFFIQQGEAKAMAYVDGFPLSESTVLEDRSIIEIGETRLKLVTLCGPNFDWLN